jgi:large subunit ribosomal protein L6
MSRVGIKPVAVPDGVDLEVGEQEIVAKGKLGELSTPQNGLVTTEFADGEFRVRPIDESNAARAMWGTMRANVQNMVTGVAEGFSRELEVVGVGFRAQVEGKHLRLELGYSHDIYYPIPEGITIQCDKPTTIKVSGPSKQQVGQVAAEIRQMRAPEPYKGKGVKYANETILRKEGKKK